MNEIILSLARQKGFEALNRAEKELVLAEMPASEYESIHLSLATLKEMDQDAAAPPSLRASLLRHPQLQAPVSNVSARKMPLAMAAAFASGALVMAFFPIKNTAPPEGKVIPQTLVQHDTIIVRDTIIQIRWKTRQVFRSDSQRFVLPIAAQVPASIYDTAVPMGKSGSAIGDTPALLEFFGLPEGRK
jgi:hypothetical protein